MRKAVVLMSHRFDAPILGEFERMHEALDESDLAFVLSDGSLQPPAEWVQRVQVFDYARIARRARRVIGDDVLRNIHLVWIDCFEAHPQFDHYWFIEYDVVYAGPWREIFDAFRDQPHDLLCCHLRESSEQPDWYWWHEIHAPAGPVGKSQCVRGFLPVARLSRRGLECLRDAVAAGWTGFFEGLVPTLFRRQGLQIGDLGGTGPFVPAGCTGRFYTSVGDRAGALLNLGTMRYRPAIAYPRIAAGRLYHPVKPENCIVDAGVADAERTGAAIANALEQIRRHRLRLFAAERRHVDLDVLLQVLTGIDARALHDAIDRLEREHEGDFPYARLRERLAGLERLGA
ncbi:MAG: hypothetical protein ABI585_05925 [Betaproteobacteria bacterium]